jgi:hypothetical protein
LELFSFNPLISPLKKGERWIVQSHHVIERR